MKPTNEIKLFFWLCVAMRRHVLEPMRLQVKRSRMSSFCNWTDKDMEGTEPTVVRDHAIC